jgi:peptidoglycan/xylan/chitin deacetylase (PgdA/CDA1 family)
MSLFKKFTNRIIKLLYQPIIVLTFHQVSKQMDDRYEIKEDWNSIENFKHSIEYIGQKYSWISLTDVSKKLQSRCFRFRKYAAISFDDAYLSILNVYTYLIQNKIPFTIFVNSKYLDGVSYSPENLVRYINSLPNTANMKDLVERYQTANVTNYKEAIHALMNSVQLENKLVKQLYVTREQLFTTLNHPLISIALHGHEHLNATKLSMEDFQQNINDNIKELEKHPHYIPYHAFTWGSYNKEHVVWLKSKGITSLGCGFNFNYIKPEVIDRCGLGGFDVMRDITPIQL